MAEAAHIALTETDIVRAKAQTKVGLLTALENSSSRAEQIARQIMIFGRVLTREEMIERIDTLSLEDVRATGAALLRSAPTVASWAAPAGRPSRRTSRLSLQESDLSGRKSPAFVLIKRVSRWGRKSAMVFFGFSRKRPSSGRIDGEDVYLRPAKIGDFEAWRLRAASRAFLTPWEPRWPLDDLTSAGLPPTHPAAGPRTGRRPGLCLSDFSRGPTTPCLAA